MSALGQKQTYAVQNGMSALPPIATAKADSRYMSALPPKADVCSALGYVRFGPLADIRSPNKRAQNSGQNSRAREDDPDFGELSRLRIDFD